MSHDNIDPANRGAWSDPVFTQGDSHDVGDGFGVFPVHAILLRTGKVLFFSGAIEGAHFLYESATWDPATDSYAFQPFNGTDKTGPWSQGSDLDLFCAHHAQLSDGRVIVVGGAGAVEEGDANGARGIWIFDPSTEQWAKVGQLVRGRWYPTAVALQDGRVLVVSGRPDDGSAAGVAIHEVLSPPTYQAQEVQQADRELPIYPDLHLVPGGKLFYTGCSWRYEVEPARPDQPGDPW